MIKFRHVCSPKNLINILIEQRYRPAYPSPLAGDSGINGYIEGLEFTRNQAIEGRGAELIIEWQGEFIEIGNKNMEHPLPPNILIRQGAWRAIIPAQTERKFIKVIDFELTANGKKSLSFFDKIYCMYFKYKLSKGPIYLTLKA